MPSISKTVVAGADIDPGIARVEIERRDIAQRESRRRMQGVEPPAKAVTLPVPDGDHLEVLGVDVFRRCVNIYRAAGFARRRCAQIGGSEVVRVSPGCENRATKQAEENKR